jgi:hypothetical protein
MSEKRANYAKKSRNAGFQLRKNSREIAKNGPLFTPRPDFFRKWGPPFFAAESQGGSAFPT